MSSESSYVTGLALCHMFRTPVGTCAGLHNMNLSRSEAHFQSPFCDEDSYKELRVMNSIQPSSGGPASKATSYQMNSCECQF